MPHHLLTVAVVLLLANLTIPAVVRAQEVTPTESGPIVLELHDGSRLRGTILRETEDAVTFRTDALGEVTIRREAIAQRLPIDAAVPPAPAEPEPEPVEAEPEPELDGLFGTPLLVGWEKSLGLGFTGKNGDVNEFGINASFDGDYEDDAIRWRLRSAYFYGETDSEQTQGEGFANLRRDWLLPGNPAFLFIEGRTDYNDFQAWQFRAGGFGGVGVSLWDQADNDPIYDSDNFNLLARLGAGASREFGIVDETLAEALLAVESRWELSDNQAFRFSNTYFPELEDLQESRNVTEASYTIKIDQDRGLSLKTGIFNEYLSTTEDDSSHNSLTYFGQLVYEF